MFCLSKNSLIIWTWGVSLIFGEASIPSGFIRISSSERYKEVIPLTDLSACFANGFGVSITHFPDITSQ